MKIKLLIYLSSLMTAVTVKADMNYAEVTSGQRLVAWQNSFAKKLYQTISRNVDGNLCFSPFNIATILSLIFTGSSGNTKSEIKLTLNISDEKEALKNDYKHLLTDLKREQTEFELRCASLIYISKEYSVLEDFASSASNDFLSLIKRIDFGLKENALIEINRDVEKETNFKIRDIISADFLSEQTRLVLINTIYFKGLWSIPFKKSDTELKSFWLTEHTSVRTPMMTVKGYFQMRQNYDYNYTLLAMDYLGDRLNFIILLPHEIGGLKTVEDNFSYEDFLFDMNSAKTEVQVSIPKFKIEEAIDLVPTLNMMGISDLFSEERCDLSSVSGKRDLFVSKAVHKAFIEIDEAGTEAAAATVAKVRLKRSLEMYETFVADRPFLFAIYDKKLKMMLFLGRFSKPLSTRVADEL